MNFGSSCSNSSVSSGLALSSSLAAMEGDAAGLSKAMLDERAAAAAAAAAGEGEGVGDRDDGKGMVQVWRVEKMEKVKVPPSQHGHFFSGESYLVLYTYFKGGREKQIIYMWQGAGSSVDEKLSLIHI